MATTRKNGDEELAEKIEKGTQPKVPPKASGKEVPAGSSEGESPTVEGMPERFYSGGATADERAAWIDENASASAAKSSKPPPDDDEAKPAPVDPAVRAKR